MLIFPLNAEVVGFAQRIAKYSEHEDHWYRPAAGDPPPGDRPEHVMTVGDVRAVFSWTEDPKDGVFRHLSVSIRGEGNWPPPVLVWSLANMFGFTGANADETGVVKDRAKGWAIDVNDEEQCIVVIERVRG
jgi:hypothetical protein